MRMVMLMTTLMTWMPWAKLLPWLTAMATMIPHWHSARSSPTWQSQTWHRVAGKALAHHKPSMSMWRQNAGWNHRKPGIQVESWPCLDNLVVELQFFAKGLPTKSTSIWELNMYILILLYTLHIYKHVWTNQQRITGPKAKSVSGEIFQIATLPAKTLGRQLLDTLSTVWSSLQVDDLSNPPFSRTWRSCMSFHAIGQNSRDATSESQSIAKASQTKTVSDNSFISINIQLVLLRLGATKSQRSSNLDQVRGSSVASSASPVWDFHRFP